MESTPLSSFITYIIPFLLKFYSEVALSVKINTWHLIYREDSVMLKYVIAWLLGVPLGLLVLIYLISHLF